MKELLRVGVLHHMSRSGAVGERIRNAVEDALTSCLRDDNRIVRIETLRALSVMLRNVRVMTKKGSDVTAALFPNGLGSLTWALDPVVARLARFPSRKTGSALASSAWYRTSVLTHVFRLFPQRTLALCDYVTRARRSDDTVRICDDLLRRPGPPEDDEPRALAARFELYLLRALERGRPDAASELERYVTAPERRTELGLAAAGSAATATASRGDAWYDADDSELAERLLRLLGVMARMWNAKTADEVADALAAARAWPSPPPMAARVPLLDAIEGTVATLIDLGERLALGTDRDPREVMDRTDPRARIRDALPAGFATVVTGILETWHTAYAKAPPSTGQRIGRYRLGRKLVDDRTRLEFAVDDPPQFHEFAIKVMWPAEPIGHERFLPGARLNHRLASPGSRVVEVIDVLDLPCPAYVMRRHDEWLDTVRWPEHERVGACERVAEDISHALHAVHAEPGGWHGAVKPCNIAVVRSAGWQEFRLGHFDRGYRLRRATGDATARDGVVPDYLALRAAGDARTVEYRRWEDVVGLLLLLYEMLTGKTVHPGKDDLRSYRQELETVQASIAARPRTRAILALLQRLFADDAGPFTARDVVDTLWSRLPPPPPDPWVVPRDLAILCVGAAPPEQELRLTSELQRIGRHLSDSRYGKSCRLDPCPGALSEIANTLHRGSGDLIVHISCHGHLTELLLPMGAKWTRYPTRDIVEFFQKHRGRVRGVVLSACHTDELAAELAKVIDVVVYCDSELPDSAAIAFTAFYKSLGDGEAVAAACNRGNLHIQELGPTAGCRDIAPAGGESPCDTVSFKVLTREEWPPERVRFFQG